MNSEVSGRIIVYIFSLDTNERDGFVTQLNHCATMDVLHVSRDVGR